MKLKNFLHFSLALSSPVTVGSFQFSVGSAPIKSAHLNERCGRLYNVSAAYSSEVSGLCCSSNGYAGYTSDHCGSMSCQSDFGRCMTTKVPIIHKACRPGMFALTFDDGVSVLTSSLLSYLESVNVKATFFINGNNWKETYFNANTTIQQAKINIYEGQQIVKDAIIQGHQICSHGWSHTDHLTVNEYNITYEMTRLNYAFSQIINKIPTCFRPPYGDYDGNSLQVLQGMGYSIIAYNVDPVDWDAKSYSDNVQAQISAMTYEIINQTATKGGFISQNHDVAPTTADFRERGFFVTNKVKPLAQEAIEHLQSKGLKLVRLDECLGLPHDSMYRSPNPNDLVCGGILVHFNERCWVLWR